MVVKVVRYLHSGRKVDTAHIAVANTSQPGGLIRVSLEGWKTLSIQVRSRPYGCRSPVIHRMVWVPHSLSNGLLKCRTGRPGACLPRSKTIYTPNRTWRYWRLRCSTQEDNAVQTHSRQQAPQGCCSPLPPADMSLVFAKFELKLCVLDFFNEKSDILQSSCHALICCEEITLRTRHSSSSAPHTDPYTPMHWNGHCLPHVDAVYSLVGCTIGGMWYGSQVH